MLSNQYEPTLALDESSQVIASSLDEKQDLDAVKQYCKREAVETAVLIRLFNIAVKKNYAEIIKYFLTEHSTIFSGADFGRALLCLINNQQYDLSQYFLEKIPKDLQKDTAFLAGKNDGLLKVISEKDPNIPLIKKLLDGEFALFQLDQEGNTALDIAFNKNMNEVVNLILDNHAQKFKPYHLAFTWFSLIDQEKYPMAELLLEKRPDIKQDGLVAHRIIREINADKPNIKVIKLLSSDSSNLAEVVADGTCPMDHIVEKKERVELIAHFFESQVKYLNPTKRNKTCQIFISSKRVDEANKLFSQGQIENGTQIDLLRLNLSTKEPDWKLISSLCNKKEKSEKERTAFNDDLRDELKSLTEDSDIPKENMICMLDLCDVPVKTKREFGYVLATQLINKANTTAEVYERIAALEKIPYLHDRQGYSISLHGHNWAGKPASATFQKLVALAKKRIVELVNPDGDLSIEDNTFLQSSTNRWYSFPWQKSFYVPEKPLVQDVGNNKPVSPAR